MESSLPDTPEDPSERVLVIDDDVVMREVLSAILEEPSYAVIAAESGDAALGLLSTPGAIQPTVLLVDLTLPGLSRAALAVRLRVVCPPPSVMIAMSGSKPTSGEADAFDDFLLKPFTLADVDAAVKRVRSGTPGVLRAGETAAAERMQVLDGVIDSTIFAKLVSVMGEAELPKLYGMFLDDAEGRVARMRSALAAGDDTAFVREAHTLKGGCGMLGATELQALAQRAESGGVASAFLIDDFQPAIERVRSILEKHSNLRT